MSLVTLSIAIVIILVLVGILFKVVVSGVIKFIAAFALVLCMIIVVTAFGNSIEKKVSPMVIQNQTVYLHIDGKDYDYPVESIRQVDISRIDTGIFIRLYIGKGLHEVVVTEFAYKMVLKADIAKELGSVMKDYTH